MVKPQELELKICVEQWHCAFGNGAHEDGAKTPFSKYLETPNAR
jgi:hypothetical protein